MPYTGQAKTDYQRYWATKLNRVAQREIKERYRRSLYSLIESAREQCIRCGESDPACLDFHHRDPLTKVAHVSTMWNSYGRAAIVEEIKKCDVICSNCHRKLHAYSS